MDHFDYLAQAELFPARPRGFRRLDISYKRFESAADALRYAIEELPPGLLLGAILEVDEERYDHLAIRSLYESSNYPHAREGQSALTRARGCTEKTSIKA
jgi:hypothetical protein